jgi:hypothetical protein
MEETIIDHMMAMFAIYNNGMNRKGKYKKVTRKEKFAKLVNYFTEKKLLQKHDEIIEDRRKTFRKRDEENKIFLKKVREENYYRRRRSEPKVNIPDLNNDTFIEIQTNEAKGNGNIITKTELIPKQNYNSNRGRFRN